VAAEHVAGVDDAPGASRVVGGAPPAAPGETPARAGPPVVLAVSGRNVRVRSDDVDRPVGADADVPRETGHLAVRPPDLVAGVDDPPIALRVCGDAHAEAADELPARARPPVDFAVPGRSVGVRPDHVHGPVGAHADIARPPVGEGPLVFQRSDALTAGVHCPVSAHVRNDERTVAPHAHGRTLDGYA